MPIFTLDTRGYKNEDRNRVIRTSVNSLETGERMILINDSDPSQILQEIENTNEGLVEWELYKETPGQFEAAVSKRYQQYI